MAFHSMSPLSAQAKFHKYNEKRKQYLKNKKPGWNIVSSLSNNYSHYPSPGGTSPFFFKTVLHCVRFIATNYVDHDMFSTSICMWSSLGSYCVDAERYSCMPYLCMTVLWQFAYQRHCSSSMMHWGRSWDSLQSRQWSVVPLDICSTRIRTSRWRTPYRFPRRLQWTRRQYSGWKFRPIDLRALCIWSCKGRCPTISPWAAPSVACSTIAKFWKWKQMHRLMSISRHWMQGRHR